MSGDAVTQEVSERVFWADGSVGGKGGYYFRTHGLGAFIKRCEAEVGKVVGIAFDMDDENICQLIIEQSEEVP
jgi:hypothetical protein